MSLTWSVTKWPLNTSGSLSADNNLGLKVCICEITASNVDVDYSNGFDLDGTKAQAGLTTILSVSGLTIRTSGGVLRFCLGLWDPVNKKARFFITGAVDDYLAEAQVDSDIIDADVIHCIVLGT